MILTIISKLLVAIRKTVQICIVFGAKVNNITELSDISRGRKTVKWEIV